MSDLDNKTNSELSLISKELEHEHSSIKNKMVKYLDDLVEIEKKYAKVKNILNKRVG